MIHPTRPNLRGLLLSLALLALGALFASEFASASATVPADLRALCAGKGVDLTRISQVKSLAGQLDSQASAVDCPEGVRAALRDLDQLLGAINGNVCSLEAVERFRDLYEAHVSESDGNGAGPERRAQGPLKNFILALGLRVSQLCKKNMINSLTIDSHILLREEDHKLIAPWTNEQSLISQLMSEPSDYDDLLLPRDLSRIMADARGPQQGRGSESELEPSNKLYIQTATGQVIRKMQAICKRRFRPIYEQLILPLVYLSNMGFNYQGEELERELKEMSLNKEIHQWYRIVYLCEPLEDMEIVEDPEGAEATRGTDQQLVRILRREQAAEMRAQFEGSPEGRAEELQLGGIEQLVYKQEYSTQIEDQVVDASNASLMKLVNKFATRKSELERIRAKLVKKLAKFMMNKLKHGQFNVVGSLMGATSSADGQSANGEIVRALDEYVEHASSGGETSVAVPKLGGIAKRYYHKAATDGVSGLGGRAAKSMFNKANIKWYFWYFVAICLFVVGVTMVIAG